MATISFTRTIVINNRSTARKIMKSLNSVPDYSSEAPRKENLTRESSQEVINKILDRF